MIAVFLLLFCACFEASSTSSPNILSSTPDRLVSVNDTVQIQCTVENGEQSTLIWWLEKKNQTPKVIAFNEALTVKTKGSPKYVSSIQNGLHTLKIFNVNEKDAGDYKCEISLDDNEKKLSKVIKLDVRNPPSILVNSSAPSVTVRANDEAELKCYASGTPPLRITWSRQDRAPLPNGTTTFEGQVLRINKAKKEHAGVYVCTAENEVKAVTKMFELHVEFKPEITVEKERVGQALQNKNALECKIAAFPPPEIQWFKEGKAVTNLEPNVKIITNALPNTITTSRLEIMIVNRTQYGSYTCKAKNLFGTDEKIIELYETTDVQCITTCGSSLDYPDFKLIFSTTFSLVILMLRW